MSKAQNYAGSKVLALADKWYGCRQQTQALSKGPQNERLRALGRYETAGEALACSVEEMRKAEQDAKKNGVGHV